jgi:hypothetical protein
MFLESRNRTAACVLALVFAATPLELSFREGSPRIAAATASAAFFENLSRSINRSLGYEKPRKKRAARVRTPDPDRAALPVPAPRPPEKPATGAPAAAAIAAVGAAGVAAEGLTTPSAPVPDPGILRVADPREAGPVELVAVGLSDEALVTLATEGYRIQARRFNALIGETITLLVAPDGVDRETGRERVLDLDAEILVDENHRYTVGSDAGCAGAAPCPADPGPTVGPAARCDVPARVGLVAGRPDLNRPGLPIDRIDLAGETTAAATVDRSRLAEWTTGLPGASFVLHAAGPRIDAFSLAAALDGLRGAAVAVVVADLSGEPNRVVAEAVAALSDADVPVVARFDIGAGAVRAAPEGLLETGMDVAVLRSTRPYLNTAGVAAAVRTPGDTEALCTRAVATVVRP